MRPLTTVATVLALCLACGESSPPVGNVGSGQPPAGRRRLLVVVEGQGRVVSDPAGIDCTQSPCSTLFPDGTTVSLTATSAAGSKFAGWGVGCSGPGACSVTLRSDVQVFAHFDGAPPAQVTLSAAVSGPGQVTGTLTCGNGASACSATLATGSPATLVATAAPQARFMGWGGACSGNAPTCQLTVQSDTAVTAAFEFELQTLVANDGTNLPQALALNSTRVFFGRRTSEGAGIWSVPKAGGTPALVSPGIPVYIVADDAFVYWTDSTGLYSAPVEGGSGSLLATGVIGRLALDEVGALYWVSIRTSFRGGSLHRMQNRVDSVIASGQNQNSGVAVDSTFAYFTSGILNGGDPAIRRVPRTGGTVETLATTASDPAAVRVDSQNVYYRETSGAVWALSKSGGQPRLLSGRNGSSVNFLGSDLDVNASVVWWMWGDASTAPKGLFRANADGTGWTGVDTGNDFGWSGPRVDDMAAYYFHAGALLKRLK